MDLSQSEHFGHFHHFDHFEHFRHFGQFDDFDHLHVFIILGITLFTVPLYFERFHDFKHCEHFDGVESVVILAINDQRGKPTFAPHGGYVVPDGVSIPTES